MSLEPQVASTSADLAVRSLGLAQTLLTYPTGTERGLTQFEDNAASLLHFAEEQGESRVHVFIAYLLFRTALEEPALAQYRLMQLAERSLIGVMGGSYEGPRSLLDVYHQCEDGLALRYQKIVGGTPVDDEKTAYWRTIGPELVMVATSHLDEGGIRTNSVSKKLFALLFEQCPDDYTRGFGYHQRGKWWFDAARDGPSSQKTDLLESADQDADRAIFVRGIPEDLVLSAEICAELGQLIGSNDIRSRGARRIEKAYRINPPPYLQPRMDQLREELQAEDEQAL